MNESGKACPTVTTRLRGTGFQPVIFFVIGEKRGEDHRLEACATVKKPQEFGRSLALLDR